MNAHASATPLLSGRYVVYGEIASGGMASVLYGRLFGAQGFSRAVAIKRLHPHFAREAEFVSMFIDEARICARLSHANLVATLDVLESPSELSLVMEYVHGLSLDVLLELTRAAGEAVPIKVATALIAGVLHGLHAAHEARGEHGEELGIIHRDVSPQNILVGADGVPRVLDFGIAKARVRLRTTPSGEMKGKLSYMAPEQFAAGSIDRRVDLYGASVVLWELLVGRTLFEGSSEAEVVRKVLEHTVPGPRTLRDEVSIALDALVQRGLAKEAGDRFATAREMASALEQSEGVATQSELSDWIRRIAGAQLEQRAARLAAMQREVGAEELGASGALGTRRVPPSARAAVEEGVDASVTVVRARRSARLLLLAVFLLAVGTGAFWMLNQTAPATPRATRVVEPVPAPPQRGDAEPTSPAQALPAEASPPLVAVPPEPEPKRSPRAGRRAAERSKSSAGSRKAADCGQPYVIDSRGVKRWKPECL